MLRDMNPLAQECVTKLQDLLSRHLFVNKMSRLVCVWMKQQIFDKYKRKQYIREAERRHLNHSGGKEQTLNKC